MEQVSSPSPPRKHRGNGGGAGIIKNLTNTRILVVEDEMIAAWALRETLEGFGCRFVAITDTAVGAIRYAAEFDTDLVLLDVHLRGDVDGISAAENIRRHSDAVIIFISGNSDAATIERAQMVQPAEFLGKPYNDRELRAAIERAIARHVSATAPTQDITADG